MAIQEATMTAREEAIATLAQIVYDQARKSGAVALTIHDVLPATFDKVDGELASSDGYVWKIETLKPHGDGTGSITVSYHLGRRS